MIIEGNSAQDVANQVLAVAIQDYDLTRAQFAKIAGCSVTSLYALTQGRLAEAKVFDILCNVAGVDKDRGMMMLLAKKWEIPDDRFGTIKEPEYTKEQLHSSPLGDVNANTLGLQVKQIMTQQKVYQMEDFKNKTNRRHVLQLKSNPLMCTVYTLLDLVHSAGYKLVLEDKD